MADVMVDCVGFESEAASGDYTFYTMLAPLKRLGFGSNVVYQLDFLYLFIESIH
jgi:hypothetical protein